MLRIKTYRRVSTAEQGDSGLGLEAQDRAIRAYCVARGFTIDAEFCDVGESGATELASRPAGASLLASLAGGQCVIVVTKLDRLFRSAGDACRQIAEWYAAGVQLCSVSEGLDLTTPYGRFVAKLFALVAELEREVIVERTLDAMESKRQRGERISRDPPYGWRFVAGDRRRADGSAIEVLDPDPGERKHIAKMKSLRRRGKSYREIAGFLNESGVPTRRGGAWSHTTVRKICETKFRRR